MDSITAQIERENLRLHILHLGETSQKLTKDACLVTANNVQREARSRLARQLGPNRTGAMEAGVVVRDDYTQVGYVVMSIRRDAREMYNLPIWIENGTKLGKAHSHASAPRPFFWPSVRLEISAHERRLSDAMQEAITAEGLG
jgi:hypothetical protein